MDEYLRAIRALWSEEVCTFEGEYLDLRSVRCDPKPANGSIPLHIGGASPAAVNRAARHGDGYFPFVRPDQDLHEVLGRVVPAVRERARELGRDDHIEMTVGGARTVAQAERLAALGIDRLVIAVRARTRSELEDELGTFAAEVIAPTVDL
jgi:alkanesulfonate monooxygenase SsuD/methylene tetrahydromethanopterin reductase-like flavin-dependent oxidoreductase (luciferase family)